MHFDVPIDEPGRASAFYRDVFDWKVAKSGPIDYWTMTTGQEGGPGAEGALALRADTPEGVVIYISVADIDVALAKIKKAGGIPPTTKMPIPNIGWSARFRDSEGNLLGLFQADPTVQFPRADSIS